MKFGREWRTRSPSLAILELKRSHFEAARGHYEKSLQIARELHDVAAKRRRLSGWVASRCRVGTTETRSLNRRKHAGFLACWRTGAAGRGAHVERSCLHRLEREADAVDAYEQAIDAIEAVRSQVAGGDQEREQFFAQEIAPYHEMISLLVRQNKPEQALAMAERASARVLLDIASGGRAEYAAVLNPEEQRRQRAIGGRTGECRPRTGAVADRRESRGGGDAAAGKKRDARAPCP